jgi:hypothetical protein
VLAPAEAFFLGRRDDAAIDHQRRRRIVKDRIDTEYTHVLPPRPGWPQPFPGDSLRSAPLKVGRQTQLI